MGRHSAMLTLEGVRSAYSPRAIFLACNRAAASSIGILRQEAGQPLVLPQLCVGSEVDHTVAMDDGVAKTGSLRRCALCAREL